MTEPQTNISTGALLARASESLGPQDIERLQALVLAGAVALREVQALETAAMVGRLDPVAGYGLLQEYRRDNALTYPSTFKGLSDWLYDRLPVIDTVDFLARSRSVVEDDLHRQALFERDPGRYLPGATKSAVRMMPNTGFGVVTYREQEWLWTYGSAAHGASDLAELVAAVEGSADGRGEGHRGWWNGILVGPPELYGRIDIPQGFKLVIIDLTQGRAV